jgi:hypothetical protein
MCFTLWYVFRACDSVPGLTRKVIKPKARAAKDPLLNAATAPTHSNESEAEENTLEEVLDTPEVEEHSTTANKARAPRNSALKVEPSQNPRNLKFYTETTKAIIELAKKTYRLSMTKEDAFPYKEQSATRAKEIVDQVIQDTRAKVIAAAEKQGTAVPTKVVGEIDALGMVQS